MNKQNKGKGGRGIEWTDWTWNPVAGCQHGCRWEMPDGTEAICYAEAVAKGVAQAAYSEGFEHHYWNPKRLNEPEKLKDGAKIFMDSMSDLMGHWVKTEEILQVLDVCRRAPQHTFQLLTKNAPRLRQFSFPDNVWAGVSMPPTEMFGRRMSEQQQSAYTTRALRVLQDGTPAIRWMSFEPLSFDVAEIVERHPGALQWAVIGAASNGKKTFQPKREHVEHLLDVLDKQGVPVFFKGNLEWDAWREEFPMPPKLGQMGMFG